MTDTTDVAQLQASAENVVNDGRVTMLGESFRVAEKVGLMPLMRFALAAKQGGDSADMEALAAMYSLLKDCIDESDWPRFERHAIDTKAEADDLLKVVGEAIQAVSARPTQRPAVSSGGPQPTSPSSNAPLSSSPSAPPSDPHPEMRELVSLDDLLARPSIV